MLYEVITHVGAVGQRRFDMPRAPPDRQSCPNDKARFGLALDSLERLLDLLRRHALVMFLEKVRPRIAEGLAIV